MNDLDERFRELLRNAAPDQWEEIRRRAPRGAQPPRRSRFAAAAVALVAAAATFALFARAFLASDTARPLSGETSSPSPSSTSSAVLFLSPYLEGGSGWDTYSSPPAAAGDASYAWASTIPIQEADVRYGAVIPPATIGRLPADGIVVTVEVVPSEYRNSSVPFPYADRSYNLVNASVRGPDPEEPPGNYAVYEIDDPEAATLVRVYFGVSTPSQETLDRAQRELDTLQLPPSCPAAAGRGNRLFASAEDVTVGETISVVGTAPFQREDGSFDATGRGRMIAWWNAPASEWASLSSFATTEPSPAVPGQPIIRLGDADMNACTFSIRFAIPNVPPGDYPVLVLEEAGNGAALEGSLVLHVTG